MRKRRSRAVVSPDGYISPAEFESMYAVDRTTLTAAARKNHFKTITITGKHIAYDLDDVHEWLFGSVAYRRAQARLTAAGV